MGMGVLMDEDPIETLLRERQERAVGAAPAAGAGSRTVSRQPSRAAATTASTNPASKTERWLRLEQRRREIEAELKTIASQQDQLRQDILGRWSMAGVNAEKIDGHTIHLQRKVYPKARDSAALALALRKEGLTDLLTVDAKAFTAWVNERVERDEPLPESIAAHLGEDFERFALVVKLA